jgi:hypothetical protein
MARRLAVPRLAVGSYRRVVERTIAVLVSAQAGNRRVGPVFVIDEPPEGPKVARWTGKELGANWVGGLPRNEGRPGRSLARTCGENFGWKRLHARAQHGVDSLRLPHPRVAFSERTGRRGAVDSTAFAPICLATPSDIPRRDSGMLRKRARFLWRRRRIPRNARMHGAACSRPSRGMRTAFNEDGLANLRDARTHPRDDPKHHAP